MMHGFLKLARGVGLFAAALAGLGIPAPDFMAWCTVVIELVAGAAVFFGAFVSLMSVPMVSILLVAIVKVHWQFGFSSIKFLAVTADGLQFGKPGVECDLLYLAAIAALYLAGSDPLSIDCWLNGRRGGERGRIESQARGPAERRKWIRRGLRERRDAMATSRRTGFDRENLRGDLNSPRHGFRLLGDRDGQYAIFASRI